MSGQSRAWAAVLAGVVVGVSIVAVPTATQAAPPAAGTAKVDRSLGLGLGQLVAGQAGAQQRRAARSPVDPGALVVRDAKGRVLVELTPQAGVDRSAFRRAAEAAGLVVKSTDGARGTLEGFVALDQVEALNRVEGRGTLVQGLKPRTQVGSATSQGVAFQRISQVQKRGLDGEGVTIGALSDSYDTATKTVLGGPLTIHAADDVASGDLPGSGNPTNKTPVAVLEDDPGTGTTDEGRAMLQITHDVAPAAKLCFATADTGSVGFANNIRRLADPADGCGADVIVDDVTYFDEPMFSDGPIADAVDDVAGAGVHYFSSAGNAGVRQAWTSKVKLVSTARALRGTNLNLDGVDPALYDGGFQDLQNGSGVDVAQDVAVGPDGGLFNLQWDDPTDLDGASFGDPYFTGTGAITDAQPEPSLTFTPTADQVGKTVQFRTDGVPSGSTDLILTITGPDGSTLGSVDTGSSPEVLVAPLTQPGPYTITVSGFAGATGDFTVDVRPVLSTSKVTTDFNVLLFDPAGAYLGSVSDLNILSGRPQEIAGLNPGEVQMVVTRSGTGKTPVTRLRNVLNGDIAFDEHADPLAPATSGHSVARGATGVAAYDPFRPFLPEGYTSPGGRLGVYFDSAGRRLPKSQQTRQSPQIASTDRGNTTFFVADDPRDPDLLPNFGGTSAAAPHAAGIAALAVQRAREEDRSLSPSALRKKLERSTFAHDLDPTHAEGKVDGLRLSADGDQSGEGELLPGSMTDPEFFTLKNSSGKTVRSVTLDGSTASPTALGASGSSRSSGIVFDPRPFDASKPRREVGFPFTVGDTSGGLKASTVSASYARPNGTGQFEQLTLTFDKGLKKGQTIKFGVDRDLAVSLLGADPAAGAAETSLTNEGNGADELGGAVVLPSGEKDASGLTFTVVRNSGRSTSGQLRNKLGSGFSPVDGYGLVDAEEAVVGR